MNRRHIAALAIAVVVAATAGWAMAASATPASGLCSPGSHSDPALLHLVRQFHNSVVIADADAAGVSTFLRDVSNYSQIHPLIVDVQELPDTEDSDSAVISNHRVTDTPSLLGIPVPVTFTVAMRTCDVGWIGSHASQFPSVDLWQTITVEQIGDDVRVTEFVEVSAPLLLMGITYDNATASHEEMLVNLKTLFES